MKPSSETITKLNTIGIGILVAIIPFQFYFNASGALSISIAQILSGLLFAGTVLKAGLERRKLLESTGDYAVALWIAVMAVSLTVAQDPVHGVKYFFKWGSFTLLYFVAKINTGSLEVFRKYILIGIVAATATSLVGIFEYVMGRNSVLHWFATSALAGIIMEPDTLHYQMATGTYNWIIYGGREVVVRVFGTFESAISFSAYIGLILPFFWYVLKTGAKRVPLVLAFLVVSAALLLNFTRSAYAAYALVAVLYVFLLSRRIRIRSVVIVCLLLGGMTTIMVAGYEPIKHSLLFRFDKPVDMQFDRNTLWVNGLRIFMKRPLLGTGVANYQSGLDKFVEKSAPQMPAHNELIQIAAETGIIGVVSFAFVIMSVLKVSFHMLNKSKEPAMRDAAIGFIGMLLWFGIQSQFNTYLYSDKYAMMFWLLVGMNSGLYRIYQAQHPLKASC